VGKGVVFDLQILDEKSNEDNCTNFASDIMYPLIDYAVWFLNALEIENGSNSHCNYNHNWIIHKNPKFVCYENLI